MLPDLITSVEMYKDYPNKKKQDLLTAMESPIAPFGRDKLHTGGDMEKLSGDKSGGSVLIGP